MKVFHQLTQSECGLACVATVTSAYGPAPTLKQLRASYETGRDGMSIRDIVLLLRDQGYRSQALRVAGDGITQVPVPFIAYWRKNHYLVVTKVTGRGVDVIDPAANAKRLTRDDFDEGFSGIAITAAPDGSERRPVPGERSPWLVLAPFLRQARGRLLLLLAMTAMSIGVTLTAPRVLSTLVDAAGSAETAGGVTLAWLLTASVLGYLTATVVTALVTVSAALNIGRDIENTLFTHLLKLPYKYFTQRSKGDLLYRLNNVKTLRTLLTNDLVGGLSAVVLVVVLCVVMASTSWRLWLLATAMFVVTMSLLVATRGVLTRFSDRETHFAAVGNGIQVDAVGTVSLVKSTGAEEDFSRAWVEANDDTLRWSWKRSALEGVVNSVVGFTQSLGPLLITAVAVSGAVGRSMSLGDVLAFQVLSAVFFSQATVVGRLAVRTAEARVMVERIEDVLEHPADDTFDGGTVTDVHPAIEVRGVSFSYSRTSRQVLTDVSISIPAGAKVAIVGPSGSGKSTLARVIAGLYPASAGHVGFGDVPLGSHQKSAFRRHVAYVEQDAPLQNRSIRENIAWGVDEVAQEDIVGAARKAQIHDEIAAMPMGYETFITNLGDNISGGQRQRVVLARALVRRPRILILDESTSALDLENEAAVFRSLADESMTRVIIAHRLETIRDADLIVVMDGGTVVERGDHESLLRAGGLYEELYRSGRRPQSELEESVGSRR